MLQVELMKTANTVVLDPWLSADVIGILSILVSSRMGRPLCHVEFFILFGRCRFRSL